MCLNIVNVEDEALGVNDKHSSKTRIPQTRFVIVIISVRRSSHDEDWVSCPPTEFAVIEGKQLDFKEGLLYTDRAV